MSRIGFCDYFLLVCVWNLVPQPGIEPRAPAAEAWSLNYWSADSFFLFYKLPVFPVGSNCCLSISLDSCVAFVNISLKLSCRDERPSKYSQVHPQTYPFRVFACLWTSVLCHSVFLLQSRLVL